MTMHVCPNCRTGQTPVTFLMTSDGPIGVVLTRQSTCGCQLDAVQKARLVMQAAEVRL